MNETTEQQPQPPPEPALISLRNLLEWSAEWLNEHGDPEGEVQWHHLIIPLTRQTAEEFEATTGDTIYRSFTQEQMPLPNNNAWVNWSNYLLELRRDERGGPPERIDPGEITRYVRRTWMQIKVWLANRLYDEDDESNPSVDELDHPFEISDNTREILGSIFSTYHLDRIPRRPELYDENSITRRIHSDQAFIRWQEIVAEMFFDEEGIGVYITEEAPTQTPAPATPPVDAYCSFADAVDQLIPILSRHGVHLNRQQLYLPISSENRMHILNALGVYPPVCPDAEGVLGPVAEWRAGVAKVLLEQKRWTIHWTDSIEPETAPEGYVHPWLRPAPPLSEEAFLRASETLEQMGQRLGIGQPVPVRPPAELAGMMEIEGLDVGTRMNYTVSGTEYRPNRQGMQISIQEMVSLVLDTIQGPTEFTWKGQFINAIIEKLTQRAIRINEVQQNYNNFHDADLYNQGFDHGEHSPVWNQHTLDFYEDNVHDVMHDWIHRWLDSQTNNAVITNSWASLPATDPDPIF